MSNIPIQYYLVLSAVLFTIGFAGVLTRRNGLVILMSIEIMLNSANLSFITFARYWNNDLGHIFVLFVFVVAAAEVSIGLALLILIFKNEKTLNLDELSLLKW